MARKIEPYKGFEQGPIRPPSEAGSLLIRITRNCPWNRCSFCFVYKQDTFSIRSVEHVKQDIDTISRHVESLRSVADSTGRLFREAVSEAASSIPPNEIEAFNASINWINNGMSSIFLQDANSLVMKPDYLIDIVSHLKKRFPWVKRITSYARSHTLARISDERLRQLKEAGLNRIHVGLESGSDKILKYVNKGSTKEQHIKAGLNVKKAEIELSEYIMPGLGGKTLSELNALETADALNQIDPDFIRLRSLIIPRGYPLFGENPDDPFVKCADLEMAREIKLMIENLKGISGVLKSDHMNNLLQPVEGSFPEDKAYMIGVIQSFLDLGPMDQVCFQIGRRLGFFYQISDLEKPHLRARAVEIRDRLGITVDNSDEMLDIHFQRSL